MYIDGSYLVRTECQTYNGGTVIVVCKIIKTKYRRFILKILRFLCHV